MMTRGVAEARAVAPELVDRHFEECLNWVVRAHGEDVLTKVADGYAFYTLEVNRAQQAYERRGHYEFATFTEADAHRRMEADAVMGKIGVRIWQPPKPRSAGMQNH